jgi:AAA domain, putative AbiEii toxin, Type IV TA system
LATSDDKLFLLEEPENDLHPTALKALLDLVVAGSASNQFVVSTHSNIVVRHLCSAPDSRLIRVDAEPLVLPTTARVEVVPPTPEARIAVLQDLGYSFDDFDLWDGWLILEESSAEKIIRDFLIPWFVPSLKRVRTLAAGGVSKVEPVFEDLNRLVLFTHLMPAYTGKTWVRVDGDVAGAELVQKLKLNFASWPSDRFSVFSSEQFERFYPKDFAERAEAVLVTEGKQQLREAKRNLLLDVVSWLDEDEVRGQKALRESAIEVIQDLQFIATQLANGLQATKNAAA